MIWVSAVAIAELVAPSAVAAAEPVAEALEDEAPPLSEFNAVVRLERSLPSELATPPANPAAALLGSCSAVRKLSADGENWLEAVLGAVWALGFEAPALLPGKLCPVENALADELAELLCWPESSASNA